MEIAFDTEIGLSVKSLRHSDILFLFGIVVTHQLCMPLGRVVDQQDAVLVELCDGRRLIQQPSRCSDKRTYVRNQSKVSSNVVRAHSEATREC